MAAFNSEETKRNLIFYPYGIKRLKEYYRFLSSGFIHADGMHLFFNMFVLYYAGTAVENYYGHFLEPAGNLAYLLLYFGGMIAADITVYIKHQEHSWYKSLGASGAVSAVMFASILFDPLNEWYLFFIPIGIPGIIMGIGYLGYSAWAAKNANDNIGHEAHFYGAIFGIVITILLYPKVVTRFINQIMGGV